MKPFSLYLRLLVLLSPIASYTLCIIGSNATPAGCSLPDHADGRHDLQNSYIVILKDDVTTMAAREHLSWVLELHAATFKAMEQQQLRGGLRGLRHTYTIDGKVLGYAGDFDSGLIERVRQSVEVGSF